MSEAQEFGGPINRPAHNARQVTPGEALTNAQPSGAGVDFLGLNQQMQGAPAASAPAPAPAATPEQSWLMEVTESAPRPLAPAAQELAPSPTAASLLNASWREETPEPRRSRWLIPVASGAVLSALGVIGLPLLRRDPAPVPAPSTLTRPSPVASTGPAAPSTLDESALAALNGEPQLEPVAPDAKLDRPERPRPGRGGAQLAQVGGRSEAPVNAPEPGSSFVAPKDVIDPSGVWTVTSGDADSSQDSDGDIDTSETIDGSPEGVTTSAPDSASAASEGVLVGECEPHAPRRAGLPTGVEVDWDRLVWIARASEVDASNTATETASEAPESAVASSPKPSQQDQGIARAVDAWNSAEAEDDQDAVAAAPEASERESDEQPVEESVSSPEVITVAEVEPSVEEAPPAVDQTSSDEVATVESSPVAPPVGAPSEVAIAPVEPVEATPESAPEQDESAVEELTAPSEEAVASSAPEAEASAEPVSAAPSARVKVLARGSGRAIERRLAAERRQARRQKQGAEEGELPLEVETDAAASSALATPISPEIPSVDPVELARAAAIEVASTSPESQAPVTQPALPPSEKPAESPAHTESVEVATVEAPQAPAQPAAESSSTPVAPPASEVAVAPQAPAESEVKVATPASEASAVSQAAPVAANVPAETETAARLIEPEPQRVLQVATAADLEKVWSGETIPLEAISGKTTLATPEIGMTRVVFHTGEVFEGELVALGEGRLWLRNSVGRIALDGARVKSAQRIAPGAALNSQAAQAKKLAGLPRARVKTPGGVLHGRVLERNERVTTIIIPSGARVVLDSRTVEVLEDVPLVQIRP